MPAPVASLASFARSPSSTSSAGARDRRSASDRRVQVLAVGQKLLHFGGSQRTLVGRAWRCGLEKEDVTGRCQACGYDVAIIWPFELTFLHQFDCFSRSSLAGCAIGKQRIVVEGKIVGCSLCVAPTAENRHRRCRRPSYLACQSARPAT